MYYSRTHYEIIFGHTNLKIVSYYNNVLKPMTTLERAIGKYQRFFLDVFAINNVLYQHDFNDKHTYVFSNNHSENKIYLIAYTEGDTTYLIPTDKDTYNFKFLVEPEVFIENILTSITELEVNEAEKEVTETQIASA